MKLSQFDSSVLVAQNENKDTLHIVTYGKTTRYFLTFKNEEGFTTGDFYENKTKYITLAYNFALSGLCGCFVESDILDKYPRNSLVEVTANEKVSINTAIRLLGFSESDHVDQCLCYLTTLASKLK